MNKSEAFRALDEDFKVELRELVREVTQEESNKKKFDGIGYLRKVILESKSGEINNGEGI